MAATVLVLQMGLQDTVGKVFRKILQNHGLRVDIVRVVHGEMPPRDNLEEYDGILLTGSAFMVTDKLPWSLKIGEIMRPVVERGITPVLGVCYGHQLLSECLGGEVDWASRRQMGTKNCTLTQATLSDDLFRVFKGTELCIHVLHRQVVKSIPKDAVILAFNDIDPYHALRLSPRCWTVQFHPELLAETIRTVIEFNKDTMSKDGLDYDQILQTVQDTNHGSLLLKRFSEICLARHKEREISNRSLL